MNVACLYFGLGFDEFSKSFQDCSEIVWIDATRKYLSATSSLEKYSFFLGKILQVIFLK